MARTANVVRALGSPAVPGFGGIASDGGAYDESCRAWETSMDSPSRDSRLTGPWRRRDLRSPGRNGIHEDCAEWAPLQCRRNGVFRACAASDTFLRLANLCRPPPLRP